MKKIVALTMGGAFRMMGSANCRDMGSGSLNHAVEFGTYEKAECGRQPAYNGFGWIPSDILKAAGRKVTCPRCLKKLEKIEWSYLTQEDIDAENQWLREAGEKWREQQAAESASTKPETVKPDIGQEGIIGFLLRSIAEYEAAEKSR